MEHPSLQKRSMTSNNHFDSLNSEYQICRRKLQSKCEALLILSKELGQCRSERDQFKLMAEQLRDRYQMVKRQLTGDTPISPSNLEMDPKTYSSTQTQSLARLLFDTKESNKSLKFEVDDLKQKLFDAEGDIRLLREQIVRSRVGTTDEGLNTRHFPAHEREDLVRQLEASREEYVQLERDLQQVLDEKEELVTERDTYRTKYERLNMELNYILKGDEKRIVDIDALSMENKFLQERMKQMEEEKTMAIATVTKYKSILEKKKTKGITKLGQTRSGGLVITQKQVQQMVLSRPSVTASPQAMADLQGLCGALLDTINDKNLALSHQRKTNKLLGNRVNELEKKLKTLEVSGLWSVSGQLPNLEKLKAECEEIKTLVPRQLSQSTDTSDRPCPGSDLDSEISSIDNCSPQSSPARSLYQQLSRLDLEELDLLPTKEEVVKGSDPPQARPPPLTSHSEQEVSGLEPLTTPGSGESRQDEDSNQKLAVPGGGEGGRGVATLASGEPRAQRSATPTFMDPSISRAGQGDGCDDMKGMAYPGDCMDSSGVATTEEALQSLLQHHSQSPSKVSQAQLLNRVGVRGYIEDSDSGDDCPDFLQSFLDRHTQQPGSALGDSCDDEEEEEEEESVSGSGNEDPARLDDDAGDQDDEDANEKFRALMESVTSKLIKRSQEQSKGSGVMSTVVACQNVDMPQTHRLAHEEDNSDAFHDDEGSEGGSSCVNIQDPTGTLPAEEDKPGAETESLLGPSRDQELNQKESKGSCVDC